VVDRNEAHGRGTIETRSGEEIPVYYNLLVERGGADDSPGQTRMSGRLSVTGNPWLESTVVEEGHILVLQDGRRLRVRVEPAGRGAETLPFRAAPRDD
jgi:hypothetical protein